MNPAAFIAKWGAPDGVPGPAFALNEEQGAQSHFLDLCELLGVAKPGSAPGYLFEEKSQIIDDILSAAGRQYSLLKKGTVGLSYTFNYAYYSGDANDELTMVLRRVNHNLTNTLALEYAFFNNLTVSYFLTVLL